MIGLDAAERSCAVADRSNLGRLIAKGPDLLALLHRLSTGDVSSLRPGEGRPTVITSAKGRIVERLFVHHLGHDGVLLVGGPDSASRVLTHLHKFTFAENTGLSDVTPETFAFAFLGPRWPDASRAVGIPDLLPWGAVTVSIADVRVHAVRTNGFDSAGALVIGPLASADRVRAALVDAASAVGGGAIDAHALEAWRIANGLPASGHELTEDYNPLEAGLHDAVSFTKGCYVGQEVVARLNTYGKVSRRLVGLALEPGSPVPAAGSSVLNGGATIGTVTSAVLPPGHPHPIALAYVKSRELPAETTAVVIDDGGARRGATVVHR